VLGGRKLEQSQNGDSQLYSGSITPAEIDRIDPVDGKKMATFLSATEDNRPAL
jgi:hypothetical protein